MQKTVSGVVILAFSFLSLFIVPAQAAMVQATDILAQRDVHQERQKVSDLMEREDLARQMQARGVDLDEAKARVASLTDEEIRMLDQKIDQLPAGAGGFIGFLLGLAIIAIAVMIITDLAGVTDIFTFIKKN